MRKVRDLGRNKRSIITGSPRVQERITSSLTLKRNEDLDSVIFGRKMRKRNRVCLCCDYGNVRKYIPSGAMDLVKMEALGELVLGHILSAICPWGNRLDLPMESNLSTAESHLVLFNATLQF